MRNLKSLILSKNDNSLIFARKFTALSQKKTLVTSALPYANGPLHIGHIAGAYLPADICVRFMRLQGKDVAFICGSDEHGAAITLRAKKEGTTPKKIVDQYHEQIKKAFQEFGISFDIYHRTSSEEHHKTAADFFKKLYENGSFIEKETEQFYDPKAEQFLADRYITGECPKCHNQGAYGDQCEKCGATLSPEELINPTSTISGEKPIKKSTSHWYLPLNEHEDWLRDWIENGKLNGLQHHDPKEWRNQVIGQCKSWIDGGLQPRAMTRDLDWGVKVPLENAEGKVLYVWLDAPIGYITATKVWAEKNGKNWKDYWQNENSDVLHFIGKDNIVFHCIIFPTLLKEHGEFNLPKNVPANEFLNLEGQKLSTSRNWAVWLHEYLEEYPDRVDELRYVLTSIAPESKDSEFTWKDYQARVNNELVAILGNFVNRVLVLTDKYYGGEVPAVGDAVEGTEEVLKAIAEAPEKVARAIESHRYREGLSEAMNLARAGNKYLAETEPWKLFKTEPEKVKTILHHSLQLTAALSVVLQPYLPDVCKKLHEALAMDSFDWGTSQKPILKVGAKISKAGLLFQKFEDEEVAKQVEKLEKAAAANAPKSIEPIKAPTSFDNFVGMDLRVAKIIEAEKVKKSNKLLKLQVDTGTDIRTVLSGIAKHYKPEEVVGKSVLLLANLPPRKMMGMESEGMILMAEDADGNLSFMSPEKDFHPGSTVN